MNRPCTSKHAWNDGDCCCNCQSRVKIVCHPWNKTIGKGRTTEHLGYGCAVRMQIPEKGVDNNVVVFSDREHGYCELYETKTTATTQQ